MNAEIMKREFDLFFARVNESELVDHFLRYLETDYLLYDLDRARDLVREEGP